LEVCDEHLYVARLAKLGVVAVALDLEILGQILVRIAVAVGSNDPDLFAAKPLAQLA